MVSFPLRQREALVADPLLFLDSEGQDASRRVLRLARFLPDLGGERAYGCGSAPDSDRLPPLRA
jgi:hypothetical protein